MLVTIDKKRDFQKQNTYAYRESRNRNHSPALYPEGILP